MIYICYQQHRFSPKTSRIRVDARAQTLQEMEKRQAGFLDQGLDEVAN